MFKESLVTLALNISNVFFVNSCSVEIGSVSEVYLAYFDMCVYKP